MSMTEEVFGHLTTQVSRMSSCLQNQRAHKPVEVLLTRLYLKNGVEQLHRRGLGFSIAPS